MRSTGATWTTPCIQLFVLYYRLGTAPVVPLVWTDVVVVARNNVRSQINRDATQVITDNSYTHAELWNASV